MRVLFLDAGRNSMYELFREEINKINNCTNDCLYKKVNNKGILFKIILGIGYYLFPFFLFIIYGNWKYDVKKYDIFIISSRRASKYAIKYILKKNKNARVIVWYWNIVSKEEINPKLCKKYGAEVWTFDKQDALNYEMNFNDTYYFKSLPSRFENKNKNLSNDVFYIGVNKVGRIEILNKLKEIFNKLNIKHKLLLIKSPNSTNKLNYSYSKPLDYIEILKNINNSRVILDLNSANQTGLTLRPMESIFFKKKLITNNKNIINYKFYNKKNIFIIGEDNFENLKTFINEKYTDLDKSIVEYYNFSSWLNRIIENKNTE